jgi:hypothetical protein
MKGPFKKFILYLFGIDVFARRCDDQVFYPAANGQKTLTVQFAEITGMVPAVFKHFSGFCGTSEVPLHDVGTSNQDFPDTFLVGAVDAHLHPANGSSDRADFFSIRAFHRNDGRRFGNAVSLVDGESQLLQANGDFGIESRTAADKGDVSAQVFFDLGSHHRTGKRVAEQNLRKRFLIDVFHDAVQEQPENRRYAKEKGRFFLHKVLPDFLDRFGDGDGTADRQGDQHPGNLFEDMVYWKKGQGVHGLVDIQLRY